MQDPEEQGAASFITEALCGDVDAASKDQVEKIPHFWKNIENTTVSKLKLIMITSDASQAGADATVAHISSAMTVDRRFIGRSLSKETKTIVDVIRQLY